jgi:hypothetical protein
LFFGRPVLGAVRPRNQHPDTVQRLGPVFSFGAREKVETKVGHGSRRKITNSQIDTDMKPNNECPVTRDPHQVRGALAIACAIILLISFRSAYATEIPCDDLGTANADELLATVDPKSIQNGGGVKVGEYDCDVYPGQKVCDWKTTLEDDRMLDDDHRLIYVHSSHQTGSGYWLDLLVFGCVSGRVKTVFQGQIGPDTPHEEVFDSAPPELQSALREYMKHLYANPVDCEQVMTELQGGKNIAEVAEDLKIVIGVVNRCREAAAKGLVPHRGAELPSMGTMTSPPAK